MSDERPIFPVVMRGYDRSQVDGRVRSLESALADAQARIDALDADVRRTGEELVAAQDQLREVDRPSYAGLGSRIEQLMRSAEEQSSDVLDQATRQAEEAVERARLTSSQMKARAENEAAEILAAARREAEEVRSAAATEAQTTTESAERRA